MHAQAWHALANGDVLQLTLHTEPFTQHCTDYKSYHIDEPPAIGMKPYHSASVKRAEPHAPAELQVQTSDTVLRATECDCFLSCAGPYHAPWSTFGEAADQRHCCQVNGIDSGCKVQAFLGPFNLQATTVSSNSYGPDLDCIDTGTKLH